MLERQAIADSKAKVAASLRLKSDIQQLVERSLETIKNSRKVLRAAERLDKALAPESEARASGA